MRVISDYRPIRFKKIKSFFLAVLLLVTSFMAGAFAENTIHFSQDVILLAPVAMDGVKAFLRERAFFKVNAVARPIIGNSAPNILLVKETMRCLIRGP